ncbi:MAG: FHA domain-containing protein [Pirellulaceae bacterium]
MLATQTPVSAAPSRLLGTRAAELTFRIQGGEHHGRILRIVAAKCSIGSAPGCTLRLRRSDIEPLHCLILSGRNGTIIRRNSPRTYLNGGPFEDAVLHAGDMLRVGSIELEVVACPQAVSSLRSQPIQEPAEAGYDKQEQQRLSTELAAMSEQLLHAREQLEQTRQSSAEQREQHTRSVNQLREQYEQRLEGFLSPQRVERAESAAQLEKLQTEQAALDAQRQQLEGKLAALENDLIQQQQRLAEQQREGEESTAVRSRLEDSVSKLTEQLRRRAAELTVAQQRGAESGGSLTVALADARSELVDLKMQRSQEETARIAFRKRMEEQFADLTARLVEREKELAHRDDELTELRQRAAHFSASDQVIKQLEESLANSALALQAERETRQQERRSLECQRSELEAVRCELESQAPLAQKVAENAALELAAQQYGEQIERWQSEAHKWQLQAAEFAGQLGEGKLLCAKLETELTELKGAVHAADAEAMQQRNLEDLRAPLDVQQQELAQARADLQEERSQVDRLLSESSSREEVLARFEAELQEREAALEVVRCEQAARLEERSRLLESQVAQFEAEQTAFARQQAAIIKQMSSLEDRVHELTTASEFRASHSPSGISRLDAPSPRGELEPSRHPYLQAVPEPVNEFPRPAATHPPEPPAAEFVAEGAPPEPAVEPSPAEVNSVVNRLAMAGLWKGDESDSEGRAEAPVEAPVPEKPKYTPPSFLERAAEMARQEELSGMADRTVAEVRLPEEDTAPQFTESISPAGSEDDVSIEQYMSRLLNRMRGGTSPSAATPADREAQPECDTSPEEITPPPASENSPEPKEYVPRAPVLEQPERLSLMRELANSAAQSAIHTHARQHQKRDTRRKSLVALLSLIGATSLAIAACITGSLIALAGATVFISICCVMSMRAITGGLRQLRLAVPQEIGDAPEVAGNSQKSERE